jgi:site-specific DNA recombinase
MTRAYGYIRVSTGKQASEGHSMGAQREKIEAYCKMKGMELAGVYVDPGQSGSKQLDERTEGGKLVSSLTKGDHVVVTKLDRAFRSAADCLVTVEKWDKAGIGLHLLDMGGISIDTKTPAGKMFLTMMAGFAEMERALASERTKVISDHLKASGRVYSQAPYGYVAVDGKLVAEPAEQQVITRMKKLRTKGLSYASIAKKLADDEIATKNGGRWRAFTIQKVLREG